VVEVVALPKIKGQPIAIVNHSNMKKLKHRSLWVLDIEKAESYVVAGRVTDFYLNGSFSESQFQVTRTAIGFQVDDREQEGLRVLTAAMMARKDVGLAIYVPERDVFQCFDVMIHGLTPSASIFTPFLDVNLDFSIINRTRFEVTGEQLYRQENSIEVEVTEIPEIKIQITH